VTPKLSYQFGRGPGCVGIVEALYHRQMSAQDATFTAYLDDQTLFKLSSDSVDTWLVEAAEALVLILNEPLRLTTRLREAETVRYVSHEGHARVLNTIFATAWRILNGRVEFVFVETLVNTLGYLLALPKMMLAWHDVVLEARQDFNAIFPDRPEGEGWPEHPDFWPSLLDELRTHPLWEELQPQRDLKRSALELVEAS
jgi:hypothetical protein